MFTIRPLTTADLPAALDLWAGAKGVELSEGDSPAELVRYLERNPDASQLACIDTQIVGALLAGHDGRRGFLYHLAVDPAFQGRGIGRALVTRATSVLKAQGMTRVLILVAADNDAGREFWRRIGWDDMPFADPMGIDLQNRRLSSPVSQ